MRTFGNLVAAAMLACAATAVHGQAIGWAVQSDGDDQLYRIDLSTGTATAVGPVGFGDVECLTFAPDGRLIAFDDTSNNLIVINTSTGAGTLIGPIGQSVTDCGLTFDGAGRLFLSSDSPQNLYQVNLATGAGTLVGGMGQQVTGLAFRGGIVYGLGGDSTNNLVRLDTATGVATSIGALANVSLSDGGLDFDAQGTLWGVSDGGTIFTINPATGTATVVTTTLTGFEGLAIQGAVSISSVPVPTMPLGGLAMLALILGAAGALASRARSG